MAEHDSPVEIEKLCLPARGPEGPLLDAFSGFEKTHFQFGMDWLVNLSSYALSPREAAVIYIACQGPEDFLALPIKLDSRTGQAHSLGNFYTSAYSPIIRSKAPVRLLVALLQYLARTEKVTGITLSPLENATPLFSQLQHALDSSGWKDIHQFTCSGNWIHELDNASYKNYLQNRPSRLQNTINRRTRHFLEGDRGHLELIEGGDALEEAIGTFIAIYNQSWKQEEPFPEFIPQLSRLAAKRGWLRLGVAHYDNTPVASQIWLVCENTAYIFKLAHGEAFKQLSPGTVLTAYMMEHVIDRDGVCKIDFLSGDDEYKRDWMSSRNSRSGIAAYNPATVRGNAMLAARLARSLLRR